MALYGTTGFGYDRSPNEFLDFHPIGFVGLQMSLPLFNGTVTKRTIEQKRLEAKNIELQNRLLEDKERVELENAIRQRAVAHISITDTQDQVDRAQAIYDQITLGQRVGTASVTDVLIADNTLREAQLDHIRALVDYLKSDLEIKKLTGNILDSTER